MDTYLRTNAVVVTKVHCIYFILVCALCTVCHGLFALPLGVIGRLWSVVGALPRHKLYYFSPCLFLSVISHVLFMHNLCLMYIHVSCVLQFLMP